MPVPGPSPAQSSLPAAAARCGAHGHGRGADAVTVGSRALPTGPALPFGPAAARPSHLTPEASPVPGGGPGGDLVAEPARGAAAATVTPNPALERIMRGPSGVGTEGLFFFTPHRAQPAAPVPEAPAPPPAAEGRPIPGLYHHPVPEPDPARVAEVSRRIKRWAVDEVEAYPPEWEDQFDGFSVGRYMVACHPDAPTVDHLMIATRLMVAENVVDDCYCEDHGGSPVGLGGRLLLAHTALDPVHTTAEYEPAWAETLLSDAPRRSYRSAMEYFTRAATPSQADRFRHDMARLHMGYLAEAAWAETKYVPEVSEYLAMRQFNNFRPCPTITDTVGGYELPAELHAMPAMQRVIALAGNATTISNDLYSYTKELESPGMHLNLPVVIAEREGLSDKEAYLKAVEVHNDLMHAFEAAAAELAVSCPDPRVVRFLRGVAVWVDGNHYWHQTNTYRYSLPDFW
ncbi:MULTISPECIES: family 2 encapsulin nanocompartment cargo protein terpene cyclase [Streptomyces]|uniref:family 2 encapsulin nanocompartment cargo protein terpene cyclase n=1 Tax=Streptomyces TaxID=1883 RepID=UPI0004BD15A9|nr:MULTISPECIES: family 2 encapsulin nanocompartment cargo protein terpene cyclase [Streptomyces]KJY18604.1 2-methylisoborneol synthase [Streptomyces sp. NRRL S-104]KOU72093.1 2-methylisoborneol synthase [Streptomyces sp. XY66]